MEVHAHTHTARKKWTHYFWEFLMLFLAVFCGFLAENFREHQVEHTREKQYMVTMMEDLRSDTVLLNDMIEEWKIVNASMDTVASAIKVPISATDWTMLYSHLNSALNFWSFKYNDRTIAQLKNSGGFRLIRNKEVANMIVSYDQLNSDPIVIIKDQYNGFYERVLQLQNKVFVQEITNTIHSRYRNGIVPLTDRPWVDSLVRAKPSPLPEETKSLFLFEFKNAMLAFRKDFGNMQWAIDNLQESISELMRLIKNNYKVK